MSTLRDVLIGSSEGVNAPARHAVAITPNDSNDLENPVRGIWVGAAGEVKVVTVGGDTVTFVGAAAGTIIPVQALRVLATGTTATGIVGLY